MTALLTRKLILVLLGAPGAGKGSQAALLKNKFALPHISTGDLLRQSIQADSPLGRAAKDFMEKGELVPDELIVDLLFERVAKEDCHKGYILDGFPRTLSQASIFQGRLGEDSHLLAIHFQIAEKTLLDRILGRRICSACQAPYHLSFSPPKKAGSCDLCNAPLIHRSDDTEEIARNRLSVYEEQTAPLLQFYENQGHLHVVSCERSKDEIFNDLVKIIL